MSAKMIGLIKQCIVYVLLLVSFLTFFSGWVSFPSDKSYLLQSAVISARQELTSLQNELSYGEDYYGVDQILGSVAADADKLVKHADRILYVIQDGTISPFEGIKLANSGRSLIKGIKNISGTLGSTLGGDYYNDESLGLSALDKASSTLLLYNIFGVIIFVATILLWVASVVGCLRKKGRVQILYVIAICANFTIAIIATAAASTMVSRTIASMSIGYDESLSALLSILRLHITGSAVVSLVFAIAALVYWRYLENTHEVEHMFDADEMVFSFMKGAAKARTQSGDIQPQPEAGIEVRNCPNCGQVVRADAAFCLNCGTKLERMETPSRFCPDCGRPILPGTIFCAGCGRRVEVTDSGTETIETTAETVVDTVTEESQETVEKTDITQED